MAIFTCPQCQTTLSLRSQSGGMVICRTCQTSFSRINDRFTRLRQEAPVPEDMTPLRIGTEGVWDKKTFQITGRIRYTSKGGYLNRWAIVFADDKIASLDESVGSYAVLWQSPNPTNTRNLSNMSPGKKVSFGHNESFYLDAVDQVTGIRLEGELPGYEVEQPGFITVDVSNSSSETARLHVYTKEKLITFRGQYGHFTDFAFKQLRDVREWV